MAAPTRFPASDHSSSGALAEIAARRDALLDRAAKLDRYAELLASGVAAGAVALTPNPHVPEHPDAAVLPAASTQ